MEINLIEKFEKTAELFPHKSAVVDENSSYTFHELKNRATVIAAHIHAKNQSCNQPIAIYLPKSCDAIASFIATLYSGNCYAPLDTKNPANRVASILQVLRPTLLITNNSGAEKVSSFNSEVAILNIDELTPIRATTFDFNFKKCIDTDPAYIIHTSGSTGIPKGVVISHLSIFDYIHWAIETFDITKNEIIGNQAPFIFDNSTLDIYLMLFTGAKLHLIPEQYFMFPAKLLDYLNLHKINFVFWVPSVLVNTANLKMLVDVKLPELKKVLFAGEVMPMKQLNYWINNFDSSVLFANLYGPTEITVDCTYYIVNRSFKDDEVLPIGFPCRNSDVLILNGENQLCELKEHGELCVRGSSLALGYWNNFEKTSAVFVQNPLNGSFPEKIYRTGDIVFKNENNEIIFVGRKDFQIKHLGYRIELGEIEHAVLSTFNLNTCVVYDTMKNEIVLVYESKHEIPIPEFRRKLVKVLSKYMIPTRYIKLEKLPLTASGKIDRGTLKKIL